MSAGYDGYTCICHYLLIITAAQSIDTPCDPLYSYTMPMPVVPAASSSFSKGFMDGLASSFTGALTPSSLPRRQYSPMPMAMGGFSSCGRYSGALHRGFNTPYTPVHMPQPHILAASLTDRDNFQVSVSGCVCLEIIQRSLIQSQGCAWDLLRQRCTDIIGACKGGCRDFSYDPVGHDCRCVPFGYSALFNGLMNSAVFGRAKRK